MGWFNYNSIKQDLLNVTYLDFPKYAKWNSKERVWIKRRNRTNAIGRIYQVSPRNPDLYFLRMLLNHQKGCKIYRDIRTVEGVEYSTYQAAAFALGLISNDDEADNCLRDAYIHELPNQFRGLFCII
jgi:hypothetical protein